jgi:hypothetical protein
MMHDLPALKEKDPFTGKVSLALVIGVKEETALARLFYAFRIEEKSLVFIDDQTGGLKCLEYY